MAGIVSHAEVLGGAVAHVAGVDRAVGLGQDGPAPEEVGVGLDRGAEVRFSTHKPDLVVTVGSPALTFVERHRALFPGIPVVMAGVAEQALQSGAIPENTVVVPVSVDLKGSIEDILKVLPGTTNIQVVFGTSPIETSAEGIPAGQ